MFYRLALDRISYKTMIDFLKKQVDVSAFSQRLNYCLIRVFQQGLALIIDMPPKIDDCSYSIAEY